MSKKRSRCGAHGRKYARYWRARSNQTHCADVREHPRNLSMHKESPIPMQVMNAGAFGFLTKDAEPEEVIRAIHKVVGGQKYIDSEVANSIAIDKLSPNSDNPFNDLSDRELSIALRLTKGKRVPDIATELSINAKTVNTYRYRMFEKLGVTTDVELTHLALRHKLIDSNLL